MFITNSEKLSEDVVFRCNKRLGRYLIKHYKLPILSYNLEEYIFSNTEQLKNIIKDLPLFVKLFYK